MSLVEAALLMRQQEDLKRAYRQLGLSIQKESGKLSSCFSHLHKRERPPQTSLDYFKCIHEELEDLSSALMGSSEVRITHIQKL